MADIILPIIWLVGTPIVFVALSYLFWKEKESISEAAIPVIVTTLLWPLVPIMVFAFTGAYLICWLAYRTFDAFDKVLRQ